MANAINMILDSIADDLFGLGAAPDINGLYNLLFDPGVIEDSATAPHGYADGDIYKVTSKTSRYKSTVLESMVGRLERKAKANRNKNGLRFLQTRAVRSEPLSTYCRSLTKAVVEEGRHLPMACSLGNARFLDELEKEMAGDFSEEAASKMPSYRSSIEGMCDDIERHALMGDSEGTLLRIECLVYLQLASSLYGPDDRRDDYKLLPDDWTPDARTLKEFAGTGHQDHAANLWGLEYRLRNGRIESVANPKLQKEVSEGEVLTIGRHAKKSTWSVGEIEGVSRVHVGIEYDQGAGNWMLAVESSRGVYIKEARLGIDAAPVFHGKGERISLHHQDEVRFGESSFGIHFEELI